MPIEGRVAKKKKPQPSITQGRGEEKKRRGRTGCFEIITSLRQKQISGDRQKQSLFRIIALVAPCASQGKPSVAPYLNGSNGLILNPKLNSTT